MDFRPPDLLRWIAGAIFLYAGALKAWDPSGFLLDIFGYRLLTHPLAFAAALYLPWLEIVCGAALIFKKRYLTALIILICLLMAFTGALISAWVRGLDITCGCFGRETASVHYPWLIARDLGLALMLTFLAAAEFRGAPPRAP